MIPASVLIETACSIARRSTASGIGKRAFEMLSADPSITVLPVMASDAMSIIELGTARGLKGMDAIVAACARHANATLVTLDNEMIERLTGVLAVKRPADLL